MITDEMIAVAQQDPVQVEAGQRAFEEIVKRSITDLAFRRTLLADPRAAIAEFGGRSVDEIPPVNIVFLENAPGVRTIVLPDPVDPGAELSMDELEAVAGGSTVAASILSVVASVLSIINAIRS